MKTPDLQTLLNADTMELLKKGRAICTGYE